MIKVQVAYALPKEQKIIEVELEDNSTIKNAIDTSGILEYFNLNLDNLSVGIFSKQKTLDTIVNDGDRVELYRDLNKG